jgi:hypothetical protein
MSVIVSGSTTISGSTNLGYQMNTDGLLLYLDAGNQNSYPGNGTTWYDISSNGNNITPQPSITYSSNSSSFFFPGTLASSYARFDVPQLRTADVATIEFVFKPTDLNGAAYNLICGFYQYSLLIPQTPTGPTRLSFTTGTSGEEYGGNQNSIYLNKWHHIVAVFYKNPPPFYTSNRAWVNTSEQTFTYSGGPVSLSVQNFNNGSGRIAGAFNFPENYTPAAYYPIFKIYNRLLSQDEITNNYNLYKTRYPFS